MIARKHKLFVLLAAAAIMLACVPTFAPVSAPEPAFDPNSINTVIAQTAAAAATQTALSGPTFTPTLPPSPTNTPTQTLTETATPTFLFFLPTLTLTPTLIKPGSSGEDFDCQVVSQSPLNNAVIQHSSVFDMHWKVSNIGLKEWGNNNADYRYIRGDKLHRTGAFDFNQTVPSGGLIDLVVPMQAPSDPGTYKTTWNISIGQDRFCPMNLTIIVN